MKILLDENLARKLKNFLGEHQVYTVREKAWSGKTNGELLRLLDSNGFDVLITADKNLRFQQPVQKHNAAIIPLRASDNRLQTLKQLVPKILRILNFVRPGQAQEISRH
jgi:predicted nuclease of predicted toxin-antitoxin system